MIPTFNERNYNEVTCAKMVIGCHTDFKGSITIGKGQAVISHLVFDPLGDGSYKKPERPDGLIWYLVVANDNENTAVVVGDVHLKILLADEPITYNVYYVLYDKNTGDAPRAPYKEVYDAFGNQSPVTVLFEVC